MSNQSFEINDARSRLYGLGLELLELYFLFLAINLLVQKFSNQSQTMQCNILLLEKIDMRCTK